MKKTIKLFQIGLRQITKDGMLLVLLPAPFLIGLVFKIGLPLANRIVEQNINFSLLPWYGLADGLLICISPMLTAIVSSFLLLEERDEGIGMFYQITPAGGWAYLLARIGMPMIWALLSTVLVSLIFGVSSLPIGTILSTSVLSVLMGVFVAMMIVSMAGNKVEGLAFSKLAGISLLGIIIVWFVPAPYRYVGMILPSYWIGTIIFGKLNLLLFCFGSLISLLWIILFTKRFLHRIS